MLSHSRLLAVAALAAASLALAGCSSSSDDADASASSSPSESASPSPTDTESAAPTGAKGDSRATFSPEGPYAGGESVTVNFTGFKPGEAVDVTICANDGRPFAGPGDCAPLGGPSNQLVNADPTGAGTATIVIINGPLGNTTPPALTCGAANPGVCAIVATDLSATNLTVDAIEYK